MTSADERLSAAVVAYVGYDGASALPGRHPERIADDVLRAQVQTIVAAVDRKTPGAQGLSQWAADLTAEIDREHPGLTPEAVAALVALETFEWR